MPLATDADHGLLPRDSVARRLNRESFLLLGGTAALLLQVAHPLVAAGVHQHSDFRRHPLGRLHRTLNTTLATVFGDTLAARRALRRIDDRHGAIAGMAVDGRAYRARDPRLLLWVQTTLVLTSLRFYELVVGPLSATDRERYWDEAKIIAHELGVPDELFPPTIGDLVAYERDMLATGVDPDATSYIVGRSVLRPFPFLPDVAYWPNDALAAGLLPPSVRDAFGLRYGAAERFFFLFTVVALRSLRVLLPERLTVVPHARSVSPLASTASPRRVP